VVWLYLRFTLSLRDVEDMLAERGLDLSYETVRRWVCKFGPLFARDLRGRRLRPTARWHLDEMVITIAGKRHWLWRAVDDEGVNADLLAARMRHLQTLGAYPKLDIRRRSATTALPPSNPDLRRPDLSGRS